MTPDRYDLFVIACGVIFALFFSAVSLFRLSVFDPQYDTVIFSQAYWNTIHHGEILSNSLEGGSHFGVHFSPVLFSLLPLSYLFPGPEALFVIKSILIALGAAPVYLCARHLLGERDGCLITLVYFFYPVVHGAAYCDFYETSFLPLLLGSALWALVTGRENLMLICGIGCLLVKEDVSLIVMMIGCAGLWMYRRRPVSGNWRFILLVILSLVVLLGFFLIIKPAFAGGDPEAANQFLDQYRDIPGNLSDHNGKRIHYLIQIFAPLLFTPLAAPGILIIALPSFLELLLSPNPDYFYVGQHYSALIIPVIFISLTMGLSRILSMKGGAKRIFRHLPVLILILTIGASLAWSPVVPPLQYALEGKAVPTWNHAPLLHQVIDAIPEDIPVAAPMNILPFLTNRHDLFMKYSPEASVILLDDHLPEDAGVFMEEIDVIRKEYTLIPAPDGISVYVRNDQAARAEQLRERIRI